MNCFVRFRRNVFVGCFVFLMLPCGRPATAQAGQQIADPRVKEILASINKDIIALAGQSEAQAGSICGRSVSTMMDMDAVVKVTSARIWDRMSPQQRDAYRAAVLRWSVRNCVQRNRDISGEPLEFVGLRPGEAGDRLLATRSNQPSHFVIWRLRGAGRLRVVDLLFDGVSMTLALRDETNTLLDKNNNDIDLAIASLGR